MSSYIYCNIILRSTPCVAGLTSACATPARYVIYCLDRRTTATLIHAYVTLCLDNGTTSPPSHAHGLHWLAVRQRVALKVPLLLTYKALHGLAPQCYLADVLPWYRPTRSLRCSDSLQLTVPAVDCGSLMTEPLPVRCHDCGTPGQLLSVLPPP